MAQKKFGELLKDVQHQPLKQSSKEGMDFGVALTPEEIRKRKTILYTCFCLALALFIFVKSPYSEQLYSSVVCHKIVRDIKNYGYENHGFFIQLPSIHDLSEKNRKRIVELLLQSLEDPSATIRSNIICGLRTYFEDQAEWLSPILSALYYTEKDPLVQEQITQTLFEFNFQDTSISWGENLFQVFQKVTYRLGNQLSRWSKKTTLLPEIHINPSSSPKK